MQLKKITITYLLIAISVITDAQTIKDSIVSAYINELKFTWSKYSAQNFKELIKKEDVFVFEATNKPVSSNNIKSLQLQALTIQQKIYKKDLGFNFTTAYQENFRSPLVDPDEIVVFRRRAIVGIDWDLLNNGLRDNRKKYKDVKREYDFLNALSLPEKNISNVRDLQELSAFMNVRKMEVLKSRLNLNTEQKRTIENLYSIQYITKEDYVKLQQKLTDIKAQLSIYESFNSLVTTSGKDIQLPLLDINIEKLFVKSNFTDSISIQAARQANEATKASYWDDVNLKLFSRYNFYDTYNNNQSNRSYVSVGLNLSMPLAFNTKDKNEYNRVISEIEIQKIKNQQQDTKALLINYFYEYRYKLKQYQNQVAKLTSFAELIETQKLLQHQNNLNFNPNTALYLLDDYWNNVTEVLNLKEDLYKILLNIQNKFALRSVNDFTEPAIVSNMDVPKTKNLNAVRAVYIWSDALLNYSTAQIITLCKEQNLNTLVVSIGKNEEAKNKLKELLSANSGLKIQLMLGSNKQLDEVLDLNKILNGFDLTKINGVHLDIEPHTQAGFKENKQIYFSKYMSRLTEARKYTESHHLTLAVSIPLSYPDSILAHLNGLCSQVYVMAYENVEQDFLNKKVTEEKKVFSDKMVLALRFPDFKSLSEMDEKFKAMQIEHVAYHDFDDMFKMLNKK